MIKITDITDGNACLYEACDVDVEHENVLAALWRHFGDPGLLQMEEGEDVADPMAEAMEAVAGMATAMAAGVRADVDYDVLAYLGLDLEHEDEGEVIARWPEEYGPYLSEKGAQVLTRAPIEQALTYSGEFGYDTDLVRVAYIKRVRGRAAATAAEKVANAAEETGGEATARKAIATAFRAAHEAARARWQNERDDFLSGKRIAASVLVAMRQVMRLSQNDLASALKISRRTLRDWETGRLPVPSGATAEVWALWRQHLDHLRAHLTTSPAGIPTTSLTDLDTIQDILLLLGGEQLVIAPAPLDE